MLPIFHHITCAFYLNTNTKKKQQKTPNKKKYKRKQIEQNGGRGRMRDIQKEREREKEKWSPRIQWFNKSLKEATKPISREVKKNQRLLKNEREQK